MINRIVYQRKCNLEGLRSKANIGEVSEHPIHECRELLVLGKKATSCCRTIGPGQNDLVDKLSFFFIVSVLISSLRN